MFVIICNANIMECDTMNRNEIDLKNKAILHKDNSLNRLDVTFLKHIELSEIAIEDKDLIKKICRSKQKR